MNPCPIKDETSLLCVRPNGNGRNEIWKVNYNSGVEECIVSNNNHSFSSPTISPDGKWILFVGSSKIDERTFRYYNTDIYVCRIDGTGLTQLTYHAADDVSPVWSKDGKFIYFISQRGSTTGTANIWRMSFNLQ
jgi:Tol biopolymer transport system component